MSNKLKNMHIKTPLIVLYGGNSPEHDVSRSSALHVVKAIDLKRYETYLIAIDQDGSWYEFSHNISAEEQSNFQGTLPIEGTLIHPMEYFQSFKNSQPLVFPLLHGPNGEDGTIQGLVELSGVPYIGSKVLSSALCMDKIKCKELLSNYKIPQTNWTSVHRTNAHDADLSVLSPDVDLFVKPANMGSSIGVTKVTDRNHIKAALSHAAQYDEWLIVEEAIRGREIEVAVLENDQPSASVPGEITPGAEFYDYKDKYEDGATLQIPSALSESETAEVQGLAVKVFKILRCRGLARVDFFYDDEAKIWFVNEINTMPGFTPISMFPKLWNASGMSYEDLIDTLIQNALIESPME